ncbi:MAG: thymidylate synthase [Candidatus Helarchaeota archaeon]
MVNTNHQLPILHIEAKTLGEAWIKTLHAVWKYGKFMPNHYEEAPSKEASVIVNVTDPLSEPKIHQADAIALKCCKLDGGSYIKEIIEGTLDSKVDEGHLSYTYHRRLQSWGKSVPKHSEILKKLGIPFCEFEDGIDQIQFLIEKAKEESISRKLQITTWIPWKDLKISGAPCLQRLWFRIVNDESLILETAWRSRDLFKAWGSNVNGMVALGKLIADKLGLELIQYVDFSNSLHIYGSDFEEVTKIFQIMEKRGIKII